MRQVEVERTAAPDDAAGLRGYIRAVRRRWFATVALRALGHGAMAAAIPVLLAGILYWLVSPEGMGLLIIGGVATIFAVAAALTVAYNIERRPDDQRVARFIEERAERAGAAPMNDCVVSAVQAMSRPAGDPAAPFAGLVVGAAWKCLDGITPSAIVTPRAIRGAATIAACGLSLLAAIIIVARPALSHAWQTARVLFSPLDVVVEVLPGNVRLVAGQELRIRARVYAGNEDLSRLTPRLAVKAGDEIHAVEMTRTPAGYEFTFDSVDRSFEYVVTAGPARSSPYTVTALFPPRVKRIDVHYEYPRFSGLPPRVQEDAGDIYAPAGTKVRLAIHVDKPVATAELTLSGGGRTVPATGDDVVHADLVLTKDDSYRIALRDRDGLRSDDDSEYFIRVMDDRPPEVRILRPSADGSITPLEEVVIEARAEDDYGVAALDLVYAVGGGAEKVVPFGDVSGGETQRTGSYLLAAENLDVRPGDVITYYARARDVGRGKPSRQTASDIFFLEVRPFNEEFVAAQSQAGAGAGGDPQIESLIEAQKEIISATWNVERRAGAGRSREDMEAIARAQADLKARAERVLAASRGRRGGFFMPQQVSPRSSSQQRGGENPIPAALEAMTRAIEQLASGRTRDAIPHEMAALNGLLQAQAEVRRRQVTQASNASGGGWGNRQSQDLSALFDKELQRQQRTNYEQRAQVEEREGRQQNESEALDRIRDLARRQEELARQQRDAAQQTAEERKRQLERLMREQQELQRALEELSRELSDQQQSGQQQSGQQQSGQQQSGQQQSGQQQAGQQQSGQQQSGQQQSGQQQSGQQQSGGQQQANAGQREGPSSPASNPAFREAVEQMRQAAGELKREDPEAAARRAARAAEGLRRLEQQMRGNDADARQRAAADLQAEAQQILQEQRRIAAEADRLAKGGEGAGADANRRLAADKDRLADRVDGLQRDTQRLGQQPGKGDEQSRAREAAAQLTRDEVADQMRRSAQQMREGTARGGEAEGQIARSLENVVEKLGGSPDTRALAEGLEQSRATRERLDELEAKLKAAQAGGEADADKLRQAYEDELRRTRDTLARERASDRGGREGAGTSTPEAHEFSRSAPGTEAFKQDRSEWESLRKEVDRALDERDAALSRRLSRTLAEDRLAAGGSERIPEQYRRSVAKYFESLGRTRR